MEEENVNGHAIRNETEFKEKLDLSFNLSNDDIITPVTCDEKEASNPNLNGMAIY